MKTAAGDVRDRIVEFRRIRAGDLAPSPRNWRTHGKVQRAALEGLLEEVGYAGALLAREVDGKLELIDGHLRASLDPEQQVPVLVLDVDQAEADKLLATLDPIAALAGRDDAALKDLLAQVETEQAGLATLLERLAPKTEDIRITPWDLSPTEDVHVVTIRSRLPIADEIRERLRGLDAEIFEDNLLCPR